MSGPDRILLSGNEAVALAARDAAVCLGTGYPGTPSTEILESFAALGCRAQWAPNEKVAAEVAIGVAFAGARAMVTMKHVGVNVAADPLFTVAYTGVSGALVFVSADDPGMASSQNEQDNRRYAVAAGVPMLEPSDSQEAYDFTFLAIAISERWGTPVLLRMTTRVCHAYTAVRPHAADAPKPREPHFVRHIPGRVMIPSYARPAHHRLRAKLAEIDAWNEAEGPNRVIPGERALGIIASGVVAMHAAEAAPAASMLKLGMTHPLPLERVRAFAAGVDRVVVVEEGDPYLADAFRAAGIPVESAASMFRFGELDVARVRRILARDTSPEPAPAPGKPPELCQGCPYRTVFTALRELDCIVAGDIGCYSLGVLPPFEAMDTLVCMGAALGTGLGLRHALPPEEARRVVSVIGDSTFVHSGITGLVEMVYNPPPTGHVVLILDNGTTAMTGMQEHPATGRTLEHHSTGKLVLEDLARAIGVPCVDVIDPVPDPAGFKRLVAESLASGRLAVIIVRRNCLLAAGKIKSYEQCEAGQAVRERLRRPRHISMGMRGAVTNIVVAGLGGQGVLTAADVIAQAAFHAGFDVKKSELHGMSQRGGSVASDVRFGERVFSPMVPAGEADFLLVLDAGQVENNRGQLRAGGTLLAPEAIGELKLRSKKSLNMVLLGLLSTRLDLPEQAWLEAIRGCLPQKLQSVNLEAFGMGREL